MKYYLRVFGWLLLGMGIVLAIVGLLSISGIIQMNIDFFGIDLNSEKELINWLVGWVVAFVAGLILLYLTRHSKTSTKSAS